MIDVLKKDATHAFTMPTYALPKFDGTCEHVHLLSNIQAVLQEADNIYDFRNYDYDNDGIVYVTFSSIGPSSGGVVGYCMSYTSNDIRLDGSHVQLIVKRQIRGTIPSTFESVFYHEGGHDFFNFPDMAHAGVNDYNHYALGGFDVMAGGGFQDQPSPYSPVLRHLMNWFTPVPITTNLPGGELKDFQMNATCYLFAPASLPSNAMPNERFYISYHKLDVVNNPLFRKYPFSNPQKGGVLIWHSNVNSIPTTGNFNDRRKLPIDIECAHGKTIWNETADNVINTGEQDPLTGLDKLEIRKTAPNARGYYKEIAGPYFQIDQGDGSIFYTPDDGKNFTFYTNPNANWYYNSSTANYAQNITSGFSVKNIRIENGTVKADFYTNDYTITQNATLIKGTWNITNTVTVAAGVTLTVNPGAVLNFSNGASIVVNGNLNATGNASNRITFDFVSPNSSTQNGIKFNSSSGSSLSYCDIKNAYAAIYCNGASILPPISYCVISNNTMGIRLNNVGVSSSQISHNKIISNSYYGILLYNSSPTNISIDTILNSPYYGVYCVSGSTSYLYYTIIKNNTCGVFCDASIAHLANYPGDSVGHNVIKLNGTGLSCAYGSDAKLGYANHRGLNSVYSNTSYAIVAAYTTNIKAEYNYWGTNPVFNIQSGSSIDTLNSFPPNSDPNSGMGKAVVAENWESEGNTTEVPFRQVVTVSDTTPVFDSEFEAALDNMSKGKFDDAIAQYVHKFKKEKNIGKRRYALAQLAECYRSAGKKDFIDFLDREIRPVLSKNDELYAKTLELENLFLIGDGKYDQAIKNYNTIMNDFSSNKEMYKHALFNIWYVYYNELKDTINSKGYISELKAKYPDDDLTMFCMVLLGEITTPKRIAAPPGLGKGEMASKEEVPNEYALFENYPNPFNPTTSIKYQIPEEGFVTIKIFDVIGREVASLVNQNQKAGKYTAEFNALNFSSGLYIYQLKVNDFISTKKMMLLK